jgi:class 3 adenylate cyclase/tetratricopeptide (TPR) repeat protein
LAANCARCGASNEPGEKFCGECGAALSQSPTATKARGAAIRVPDSPAPENLEGERKTVTALFADIKGLTELEQDLDPEEARAIVDPALKLMIDAVQRYDGYVVQSTGDGIFAIFGAPAAREDHPQRALYAALRMQDELRRYSTKLVADGGNPLQCRVGVNTGEVVVRSISTGGKTEYTPIGHTTNLASRMQAVAPVGSIAVAEPTRKLCEGYFVLKALGPTKVRGVSEPVNVYEVAGLGPLRTRLQRAAGRGLTKFVGREQEMTAIARTAELAYQGHGQIVAAVAEAGTGKSRLFFEFKAKNQSGWMVLEAFSVSHGKASAYLPVLDLLHGYFRITAEDDARTRREKVAGRLAILDPPLEDARPYLFALLGIVEGDDPLAQMDANIRKRRTLDAIKRILLRESLNQPVIVMFEDLHWIDEQTQEFLNLLADSIANAKILLLVNYRPQYSHSWNSKTYYTQLRLDPLGKESADEMLAALLGDGADLGALKRLIIERTEGNPFFMEETVQVLLDEGALIRNGAVHLTRPVSELKIPPTVQGILAARIDRLPADEKDLLQTLAVMGKEFTLRLVRAVVTHSEDEINRMLNNLQLSEFIYEQPAVGDVEYAFKHALTQEVAYNSVLQERRRALHERIGAAIESLYADSLDDYVEQLAHHYRRSNDAAKAIDYVARAADMALTRNAVSEAITDYKEALELLDRVADPAERQRREAALQVALGGAMSFLGPAAPGVESVYERARELCERVGDREGFFAALSGLRIYFGFRADLNRALELSEELLKVARDDEPQRQASAHANAAQTLFFMGEFGAAREHLDEVRGVPASVLVDSVAQERWQRLMLSEPQLRLVLIMALLGFPDQALAQSAEALAFARQTQIPLSMGLGELICAQYFYYVRNAQKVHEHSEASSRIAIQNGFGQLSGYAGSFVGWAQALAGDFAQGISQIRRSILQLERVGARILSLQDLLLIECLLRQGDVEEALSSAAAAITHAATSGERYVLAELNRLKGELLLIKGGRESAEVHFRTAIEVARAQEARWWEIRATLSLARLLRDTNRRDEARATLAEIYGWFTEGFDTADLKDAKALLDELAG